VAGIDRPLVEIGGKACPAARQARVAAAFHGDRLEKLDGDRA
jgi:hypothetical protein